MCRRFLVKSGVPFDVAYSYSDDQAAAEAIAYGILNGGEWDWSSMDWKRKQ